MPKKIFYVVAGLLILGGVFTIAAILLRSSQRTRTFQSRPLVLIHNPINQDRLTLGKGTNVFASARAQSGVARMELWVDGAFVAERKAPENTNSSQLVMTTLWSPRMTGSHTLVVRAYSNDQVEGQATVGVDVTSGGTADKAVSYLVQEGDTLQTIAANNNTSPEAITTANPDLGSEGPQVGDTLDIPPGGGSSEEDVPGEEDVPSGDSGEPPASEEPPGAMDESPGSGGVLDLIWEVIPFQPSPEPTLLRVEALALETRASYEALHCYASLARGDNQWYPDADHNQSTDESFASSMGGRAWNVAAYFSGDAAPTIEWPSNRALPFEMTCVGTMNGGTEAVEIGKVKLLDDPETWGTKHSASSIGGEGQFRLDYQISKDIEKGIDPNMTPPANLRLDALHSELQWDYTPRTDETPIDGFAILLNDTLQWTEPASDRASRIPTQWVHPPCGDHYNFTVVAYIGSYPDGLYSPPSNTRTISGGMIGGTGCERTVIVTFGHLSTGDLGGDGERDPGDMGPVYGNFYVDDNRIRLDGRPMEGDNFHNQLALNHHSEYNISDLTSEYGDGPAQIEVNLPQGDPNIDRILFWVGFDLMDADTGWHNADDPVCSGEVAIYESQLTGDREGTIDTDDPSAGRPDRCRVTFTTTPLGAGAMVPPGSPPPLPDLVVDDLTVDRSSGNLAVHVRNRGQASWAGKDLDMRVLWPSGEVFGEFTMPNVTIAPGDRVTLMHGGMDPHPALGACVLLDPNNDVQEVIDREIASGLFSGRPRYCRPLPDLSITDAQYNPSSHQLEVSINNYGEVTGLSGVTDGSLDGANLNMRITVPEGRPMTRTFSDVSIGVRGTKVLDWPLSDIERGRMHGGYTITVDPNNDVAETNDDNNSYELPGSTRLRLVWSCGFAEFCVSGSNLLGGRNTWDLRLYAIVSGGGSHQVVADWQSPEFSINWHDANHFWCTGEPHVSDWFELAGDQELVVSRSAGLDIVGHGYRWLDGGADALRTENNFGGVTLIPADLNPQRFVGQVPCDYDAGPSWGTAGCGVLTGPNLSQEGVHRSGQIYASGEGINGTCRWATSYGVYQAE